MKHEDAIETIRILLSRAEELDGPNLLPDEEEALEMALEAMEYIQEEWETLDKAVKASNEHTRCGTCVYAEEDKDIVGLMTCHELKQRVYPTFYCQYARRKGT